MKLYTGGAWVEVPGVVHPDGSVTAYPLNFDADYAASGTSRYRTVVNASAASIVDDPILGASRKVLRMAVDEAVHGDPGDPANKARCQAETPFVFGPGHDVWVGFGVMFPTDWPVVPAGGWCLLHEFHGPPFTTGSPNALEVDEGDILSFGDVGGVGLWQTPLLRNTWMDFVIHVRFAHNPLKGFAEIWMNTGTGWVQQRFKNGALRRHYATLGTGNGDGWNDSMVKQYRKKPMWTGVVTNYFAEHRLGSSFAQVAPTSYA